MNTVRLNYVAEKMAPMRRTVAVEAKTNESLVTLDCGHVKHIAPHFHVTVGEEFRCSDCGKIAALKLPEFNA